jgi:hypothetical protein
MELKKKEEEMSSIIKLRKPDEIKFSDDVYDKPIGDDMERLLAETLASRERELEQLNNSTGKEDKNVAEKWINPNSNSNTNSTTSTTSTASATAATATDRKKKVSFNNVQTEHEPTTTATATATEVEEVEEEEKKVKATLELNTLMTKFKKINTTENTNKTSIQNNQNQNSQIIKISEDVAFIKQSIIELTEKINESILNQRR